MKREQKKFVVLSHGPCTDGAVALWVAHEILGDRAEYGIIEPKNGEAILKDILEGNNSERTLYLLDYMPDDFGLLDRCLKSFKHVGVIDHHPNRALQQIQAEAAREGTNLTLIYDRSHSAAGLVFEKFNALHAGQLCRPWLLDYVEQADLGKLHVGHEYDLELLYVTAYLDSLPKNTPSEIINSFDSVYGSKKDEAIEKGRKLVESYRREIYEKLFCEAMVVKLDVDINGSTQTIEVPVVMASHMDYPRVFWNIVFEIFPAATLVASCNSLDRGSKDETAEHIRIRAENPDRSGPVEICLRARTNDFPMQAVVTALAQQRGGGHPHSAVARPSFGEFIAVMERGSMSFLGTQGIHGDWIRRIPEECWPHVPKKQKKKPGHETVLAGVGSDSSRVEESTPRPNTRVSKIQPVYAHHSSELPRPPLVRK